MLYVIKARIMVCDGHLVGILAKDGESIRISFSLKILSSKYNVGNIFLSCFSKRSGLYTYFYAVILMIIA